MKTTRLRLQAIQGIDMLRTGAFVALLLLMLVLASTVGNNASSRLSQESLHDESYTDMCYSACTFSHFRFEQNTAN